MKKILFFGDSITDMFRNESVDADLYKLGFGFVSFVAGDLFEKYPKEYEIINRGISGNRVSDLLGRYENDVVAYKPDYLSILIGVNDIWHGARDKSLYVTNKEFKERMTLLLDELIKKLPGAKILLVEPFVIHGDATDDMFDKFARVKKLASIEAKLAKERGIPFLKLQKKIEKYASIYGNKTVIYDGVHPNLLGAKLIAKEWIKFFLKNR